MRRRHVRTVREEERPSLLLMAAGAVAGAAAGLYLGHRYRSMDAFLDDMRGRVSALRDIWYDDELAAESRMRVGADLEDDLDDDEVEDEDDDEVDELDEDELDEDEIEGPAYDATDDLDEEGEDIEFDEDEEDDVDEFEDEIASVTSANGASQASITREEAARQLEQRVLRALRDEPVLSERAIEISVVGDGVVELTGTVRAIEEVSRASALARNVKGVSMVLNRIDVRTGGSIDTASVAREREDASPEDRSASE